MAAFWYFSVSLFCSSSLSFCALLLLCASTTPSIAVPSFVPSRYGARFAYGHIVEGNRHMIVSGGLGTSFAPVRLGVPPEIMLVTVGGKSPAIS